MNPIVIDQTPDEARLAFEVHQHAAIQRIRLARAKVSAQVIDDAPKASVSVSFNFRAKALVAPKKIMRLEIGFRMAGVEDPGTGAVAQKQSEPVVSVECSYEVDYVIGEDFEPSAEHVKAFKDGNAIFNVWPYFREYLQNNLQRMGLPPLVAPFLRLQPKPKRNEAGKGALRAGKKSSGSFEG